jgi:hypothetical protein
MLAEKQEVGSEAMGTNNSLRKLGCERKEIM